MASKSPLLVSENRLFRGFRVMPEIHIGSCKNIRISPPQRGTRASKRGAYLPIRTFFKAKCSNRGLKGLTIKDEMLKRRGG